VDNLYYHKLEESLYMQLNNEANQQY